MEYNDLKYQLLSVDINGIIQDKDDFELQGKKIIYKGDLRLLDKDSVTFQYIKR